MLLPAALPMPAAQAAPAAPAFHEVRLLFQDAETMSTAPFDTATTSTPQQGWVGGWLGPVLPTDVTLSKADGFHILLPSRTSQSGVVTTRVEVSAVGLLGERVVLANATFVTPRSDVGTQEKRTGDIAVENPSPKTTDELVDSANEYLDGTDQSIEMLDGGQVADQAICTRRAPECSAYRGDPGYGPFFPCRDHAHPYNLPGQLLFTIVHLVDDQARALARRGVCDPLSDDVNATWDATAPPLPPLPYVSLPRVPAEVRAPDVAAYSMPTVTTSEEDWTSLTLALDAPDSLPQDEKAVRIPSGFRLALSITERVDGPTAYNVPSSFLYGHPDAPGGLGFTTSTPGAFGLLTGGAPLELGTYAGEVRSSYVDHRLKVPAGRVVNVSHIEGSGRMSAWDEEGTPMPSGGWANFVFPTGEARNVLVRFARATASASPLYAITVRDETPVPLPQLSPGEPLTSSLGPGVETFEAEFFAWQAQRFTLTLTEPADASYQFRIGESAWDVARAEDGLTITARAYRTGVQRVTVERDHGSGPFVLGLHVDEGGNLSDVPMFTTVHRPSSDIGSYSLHGHAGGVDIVAYGDAWHVNQDGATYLGEGAMGPLLRTADGEFVGGRDGYIYWDVFSPAKRAISGSIGWYAFGGDGAFYTAQSVYPSGAEIVRIAPDRTEIAFDVPHRAGQLLAGPDGRLRMTTYDGETFVIDFENRTSTRAPTHEQGAVAFDVEGRAYRIVQRTLVERSAPSGETRIVAKAWPNQLRSIVLSGDSVWASVDFERIGVPGGIARVPLDGNGFSGFEPAFVPAMGPNLRVAAAYDTTTGLAVSPDGEVSEKHVLMVQVENDGDAPVRLATVLAYAQCLSCNVGWEATIAALAPGETRILEFPWDVDADSPHIGDRIFQVIVDSQSEVAESDETDNRAEADGSALVTGNRIVCDTVQQGCYVAV